MIKNLLIFLIIANIEITLSLGAEKIFIYDVETPFDQDYNEFTFEYNGDDESTYYVIMVRSNSYSSYQYSCDITQSLGGVHMRSFGLILNMKKE